MEFRRLTVEGAVEFVPQVFRDERGLAVQQFRANALTEATGRPLFPLAQTLCSRSRRGVVRGVHFTATPPGSAKYVYCTQGAVLDIVIDVRVGSPSYRKWDAVGLDQRDYRAIYLPVGVGHAFVALEDDTIMNYLLSGDYVPEHELALSALDSRLGLPVPTDVQPIVSERDRVAPTFAEAEAAGLLPDYDQCRDIEDRATRPAP